MSLRSIGLPAISTAGVQYPSGESDTCETRVPAQRGPILGICIVRMCIIEGPPGVGKLSLTLTNSREICRPLANGLLYESLNTTTLSRVDLYDMYLPFYFISQRPLLGTIERTVYK